LKWWGFFDATGWVSNHPLISDFAFHYFCGKVKVSRQFSLSFLDFFLGGFAS